MNEMNDLRHRFVRRIYATHNDTPAVRCALTKCLNELPPNEIGLNVGSGLCRLHPAVFNLDIISGEEVDCRAFAEALPFPRACFSLVVTQETLEHVRDPFVAVREMYRVLKPNGVLYCQVPFIIGYHPGPTDFWRFTRQGIREIVERAGFRCEELAISVGCGTGLYRIVVEFWAVFASAFLKALYVPVKGVGALVFYPLKWIDRLLMHSEQADRIAGGYYVIARKVDREFPNQ